MTITARLAYPAAPGNSLWVGLLLQGAAIELAQAASGWRHGDVADWIADAVGVGIGWILLAAAQRRAQ